MEEVIVSATIVYPFLRGFGPGNLKFEILGLRNLKHSKFEIWSFGTEEI